MGLFELHNHLVVIRPESLVIPEMMAVWDRDKTKEKSKAYKELAYIYFMVDYKSPYNVYPDDIREQKVREDFVKDDSWKPDRLILTAAAKYEELQITPSMQTLKSARKGLDMVRRYFDNVNEDTDIKELMQALEKVGKSIEGLDKLEEKVKKEITTEEKVRGGGVVRERER
jgi:hypothetical protein